MNNNEKAYIVQTPAGKIYVDYASDAAEYKKNYGYFYYRNPDFNPD